MDKEKNNNDRKRQHGGVDPGPSNKVSKSCESTDKSDSDTDPGLTSNRPTSPFSAYMARSDTLVHHSNRPSEESANLSRPSSIQGRPNSSSVEISEGENTQIIGNSVESPESPILVDETLKYDLTVKSSEEEGSGDSLRSFRSKTKTARCKTTMAEAETDDARTNSDKIVDGSEDNDSQKTEVLDGEKGTVLDEVLSDTQEIEMMTDETSKYNICNNSNSLNKDKTEVKNETRLNSDEGFDISSKAALEKKNNFEHRDETPAHKNEPQNEPIPGPSTSEPVAKIAKLKHIESVMKDAKKITEILERDDIDEVYERLKSRRGEPNRVDTVSNEILEEDTITQKDTSSKGDGSEMPSVAKVANETEQSLPSQSAGTGTGETDIFYQVQQVLKINKHVDANRVFHLLEVFSDSDDPIKNVIEHLKKNENKYRPRPNVDPGGDETDSGARIERPLAKEEEVPTTTQEGKSTLKRGDTLRNDALYTDTLKLRAIFPDKNEQEIYAHLEVYHERPNRLQLVMEEFLASNNDTFTPNSSLGTSHSVPQSDSQDSQEEGYETDKVLKRFKKDVKTLKSIFPDCDVQYIMTQLQGNFQARDRVAQITAELLHDKDYPKVNAEASNTKKERKRLRKLRFDVKEFLKLFPDPNALFYEEEKNMDELYQKHAAAQLYEDYRDWKHSYIDYMLKLHNYHYLPTLRHIQADMVVMDPRMTVHMALDGQNNPAVSWPEKVDEYFYRERLFSRHEDEVQAYFKKVKEDKERRLEEAKANNELQECQCCFDDENLPEDMVLCPAGHPFCNECVVRMVQSAIGESKTNFPCLTGSCPEDYPLSLLQNLLPTKTFSLVLRKTQEEELRQANIPDLVACPFCPYATIMPDENDKVLKCQNPECLKETCRLCKELNHIPLRCDEVEKQDEVKMRTFIEQKMAEAMLRTCPKCQRKFYKIEGCNKMTCVCGQSMCYVCREPIEDYSHFEDRRCGEQGQGAMDVLHRKEVEAAARDAEREYRELHPEVANIELKNDPTKDLDKVGVYRSGDDDDDGNDDYYDSDEYSDDEPEYEVDEDEELDVHGIEYF